MHLFEYLATFEDDMRKLSILPADIIFFHKTAKFLEWIRRIAKNLTLHNERRQLILLFRKFQVTLVGVNKVLVYWLNVFNATKGVINFSKIVYRLSGEPIDCDYAYDFPNWLMVIG